MQDKTSDMDTEVENQINDMISSIQGNTDSLTSFTSEKNTNVTSVQFVIKTEAIQIEEEEIPVTAQQEQLTFFQKLKNLFKH